MLKNKTDLRFLNIVAVFIFLTLLIKTLQAGKSLLIPLVIAIVLWYIIITLTSLYENLKWFKWKIPHWLAKTEAVLSVLLLVWFFVLIINSNVKQLIEILPTYQIKIQLLLEKFSETWNIERLDLANIVSSIDVTSFFSGLANGVGVFLSYGGTITIYLIFLLLEYRQFHSKWDNLFTDKRKLNHLQKILSKINADAQTYIKIQTLISLLTGILFYLILLAFGVPFAAFWGMLTFILNYIPVLGSMVATILPFTLGIIELNSPSSFLLLGVLLISVQVSLGNIMLPRLMGKSLNLSPLVILLSLSFWGMVWGIPGMFLSVPIMVILNIVLAQFKSTRWLAVMFSGTGKLD